MEPLDLRFLEETFPFWKGLTLREQQKLLSQTRCYVYPKGSRIHSGLEGCTGVLAVKRGQLRAYLMSDEGKEITLYRLLDGDVCFLSASCILKNISFDIYVDTEEETELYLIQASAYDALGKSNLAVQTFLQETISARFSDVMWVVEQIVFMKFDRRLAIFLLEQAALEGNDAVTLTHEQIAHHMGSAREVVSRMLKYFQNEGLVEVSRKGIRLLDRKALDALARE